MPIRLPEAAEPAASSTPLAARTPAQTPPVVTSPLVGPVDRVSFFAEQQQHRRATWRLTAICALAALLTGIPLSLVFTPLIFAAVLIGTRLASFVAPVPDGLWNRYEDVAMTLVTAFRYFDDATPAAERGSLVDVILGAAVWLLPGMLAMLLLWPLMRALFHRAGAGGALLALGAREPDHADLEEHQLVNVVEEMAIAAGLPAPRVMLLDAPVANVAVAGSSPRDATVIVSRRTLDVLDRDETQGALGHVIASAGNGDLGVALTILSVHQTFGLVAAIIKAPFSPHARRTLWRLARFLFRRGDTGDAEAVNRLLTHEGMATERDDFERLSETAERLQTKPNFLMQFVPVLPLVVIALFVLGQLGDQGPVDPALVRTGWLGLAIYLLFAVLTNLEFLAESAVKAGAMAVLIASLPYYLGAMMPQFLLMILSGFVLSPMMALAWRTRRYLADASAVQLTRNPDGVARALMRLTTYGGLPAGARWAAPLFIVGGAALRPPELPEDVQRAAEQAREGNAERPLRRLAAEARVVAAWQQKEAVTHAARAEAAGGDDDGGFGGGMSSVVSFHPGLARRLRRLRAVGATIEPPRQSRLSRAGFSSGLGMLLLLILVPLLALLAVLFVVLIVLMLGLSLLFCGILMLAVFGLFSLIR